MKVWIKKPISEPPEKNGWYLMVGSECFIPVSFYWDNWLRCWKSSEHDKIETDWKIFQYTHYLVPAEGNFLTDAELEKRDRLILNAFINSIRKETGASQGLIMIAIQDNKFLLDKEPVISWLKSNAPKF